jgi:hypothetical protein
MSYNNFIDEIDGEEEPSLGKYIAFMTIAILLTVMIIEIFY